MIISPAYPGGDGARVRAVLRRTMEQRGNSSEPSLINYQGLQLNLDKKSVTVDGECIATYQDRV